MALRPRIPPPPTALLFPSLRLNARYEVGEQIGSGSFSSVYRAWDTQQRKAVAMKCAHVDWSSDRHVQREAHILSALQHPCIPTYIESFQVRGRWHLVEEWREGTPMSRQSSYSLAEVIWIGEWMSAALDYLHQSQPPLVHRDIAPNNVLLSETTVSLIDFGLAAWVDEKGREHAGTPGYVAPEQWDQGEISPQADIYSLGMLLGCALTDCQPERVLIEGSFTGLWDDTAFRPEEEIVPLLQVLDRMISKKPRKRPPLAKLQAVLATTKALPGVS